MKCISVFFLFFYLVPCTTWAGITGIKLAGDTCNASSAISLQAEGTSSSPYFFWDFDDPASGVNDTVTITGLSASPFPTHTFTAGGVYNVCVTFTEPGFSATTICRTISIGLCNTCVASISGTTLICSSGNATLIANAGSSYLWSTGATTQSITTSIPNTYKVTVTDNTGCTESASVNVNASGLAAPNISTSINLSSFCFGTVSGNSNVPGATYVWTGPGTPATTTNPLTIIYPGTYTLTVINPATGCSKSGQVTGSFPGSALITASNDVTICPGDSTVLSASGGTNYTWSPATGLSGTSGATVTAKPMVTTTYVVTNTTFLGCPSTDTVRVTVANGTPPSISGNLSICAGGSTTLTASPGISYVWSTGATTPSITVNTPGNYRVTVTPAGSCPPSSATVTVTSSSSATSPIYHD